MGPETTVIAAGFHVRPEHHTHTTMSPEVKMLLQTKTLLCCIYSERETTNYHHSFTHRQMKMWWSLPPDTMLRFFRTITVRTDVPVSATVDATNTTKISVENTSSYLLENLSPSTSYDLYVRAVCNTDGNSAWEGPINFRTLCGELNAPFYESFSLNTIPHCWIQSGAEAWNFNTNGAYDASSAGDFTPSGNTNYAWIDGSSPNGVGHKSYLRTLPINISGLASPSVQFSVFSVNNHDNSLNTLNVKVFDDTGSAQNLFDLQGQTQNGGWETFTFNLSD